MARELDGVHVMVVEDNDDSRDMLRVALEYCGALVTTAGSVEEALSMLGTLRNCLCGDQGRFERTLAQARPPERIGTLMSLSGEPVNKIRPWPTRPKGSIRTKRPSPATRRLSGATDRISEARPGWT